MLKKKKKKKKPNPTHKSGEDKKESLGRISGDFIIDGKRATDILIEEGHAVAYFGGLQKKKFKQNIWLIEKDF